jgi:putative transposase
MARLRRIVLPGIPHHITQRGNRRQQVFFEDADYAFYLDLFVQAAEAAGTEIWAYCLMPNHVHMIVVPHDADGLRATFAEAHRQYTGYINARAKWTGHLWQGRYGSVAMDDAHTANAVRYIALNPVTAGLVTRAEHWPWSSAAAHLAGKDSHAVRVAPVLERVGNFGAFLYGNHEAEAEAAMIERGLSTGRPMGSREWLEAVEAKTGLSLIPQKRGRKPQSDSARDRVAIGKLSQKNGKMALRFASERARIPLGNSR